MPPTRGTEALAPHHNLDSTHGDTNKHSQQSLLMASTQEGRHLGFAEGHQCAPLTSPSPPRAGCKGHSRGVGGSDLGPVWPGERSQRGRRVPTASCVGASLGTPRPAFSAHRAVRLRDRARGQERGQRCRSRSFLREVAAWLRGTSCCRQCAVYQWPGKDAGGILWLVGDASSKHGGGRLRKADAGLSFPRLRGQLAQAIPKQLGPQSQATAFPGAKASESP